MTNYEKFMNMSIREFAESRLQWDADYIMYSNTYSEEEKEQAIQDEIEWLNQESR